MRRINTMLLGAMLSCVGFAATAGNAPKTAAAEQGKQVFDKWCAMCHAPGERMPGTASLAVKYGGSVPAELEKRTDMTPEFVRHFVRNGVLIMPSFRKTEITDAELDALAVYLGRQGDKP